ncbi:hypothetical protein CERSUDRAFT_74351 [Gelatoporia subvermispora B]|uniref:Uncharacterized protein n=1 Tax=Ceriporiopsis subvermispora (strain B) TaxID=914234 RepID=M2QH46_CERS8|nr:hypothetical protein CERSUDRAFT_74351 [Gelatoporia subvermispora B]
MSIVHITSQVRRRPKHWVFLRIYLQEMHLEPQPPLLDEQAHALASMGDKDPREPSIHMRHRQSSLIYVVGSSAVAMACTMLRAIKNMPPATAVLVCASWYPDCEFAYSRGQQRFTGRNVIIGYLAEMHLQLKRSYTQHTRYPASRLFDGSSSDLPSTHALTAGHTTEDYMVDLESGYSYYDKRARGHPWTHNRGSQAELQSVQPQTGHPGSLREEDDAW